MPSRRGVAGRARAPGCGRQDDASPAAPTRDEGRDLRRRDAVGGRAPFLWPPANTEGHALFDGLLSPETLAAVASIVVIDLVLSGDNAVVIGMAASQLPGQQRRSAILFGAAGAIGLRVMFTAIVALLLGVPLLQLFGGLLLTWIAIKLLRPHAQAHGGVTV